MTTAAAGIGYAVLALLAFYRLVLVDGCCVARDKYRTFHVLLVIFSAFRASEIAYWIFVEALATHTRLILNRIALMLFFALFTHVVVEWCVIPGHGRCGKNLWDAREGQGRVENGSYCEIHRVPSLREREVRK